MGAVHPAGTASAVINLTGGEYVILCLIPSPSDLVAHHAKGMIQSLIVEVGEASASEPKASFTYTYDFRHLTFNHVSNPGDDAVCQGRHADFNGVTYSLAN